VLLHVPNFEPGLDLHIHVRTTIRHDYSYIESAAVQIGDDILDVESFGQYAWNGVDNANLAEASANLAGYPIIHSQTNEKQHVFDIVIGPYEKITIATFKDMVSVMIHDSSANFRYQNSVGLMGSFDEGNMLARNGTTIIKDPDEFGQEWQVRSDELFLFRTVRAPQYPQQKCILPSSSHAKEGRKGRRRLAEHTITQEQAEEACIHLMDEGSREACIMDGKCHTLSITLRW